jgi:hypothetical protein
MSEEQIAIRSVFKKTSYIAKMLFYEILKPYTFPVPEKCSAYHHVLHLNRLMFINKEWDPERVKLFEGPLENPGVLSAVLTGLFVTVSFDAAEGKGNDAAIAVVYEEAWPDVFYAVGKRSDGAVVVPVSKMAAQNTDSLHVYLAFSRPPFGKSNKRGINSVTAYKKISV